VEEQLNLDLDNNNSLGRQFTSTRTIGNVELGSTSSQSTQLGYALRDHGGSIIQISNAGVNASATSVPGWTPVAAVASAAGYELFWRHDDGRHAQWLLNSQGALVGSAILSAGQRRVAETRLNCDINADGIIGQGIPGIYMGSYSDNAGRSGNFAFIARENGTGAAIAYNSTDQLATGVPDTLINDGQFDALSVEGDQIQGSVNGSGISGSFYNSFSNSSGQLSGLRKSDDGPYAAAAGAYTGYFDGSGNGEAYAIAAADGSFYFYTVEYGQDQSGPYVFTDGGFGQLVNNRFEKTYSDGITISITLNPATKTITGSYSYFGQRLGNIYLSLQPD